MVEILPHVNASLGVCTFPIVERKTVFKFVRWDVFSVFLHVVRNVVVPHSMATPTKGTAEEPSAVAGK